MLSFYSHPDSLGVFSSRKLVQSTYDSVAFRFITADTHPDHATLATFCKRFLKELDGLFVQLLVMAKVMRLLQLGHVSLDGTKIKATASKHKALSWGYANQLEEQLRREVQELLRRAEQADAEAALEIDIPDELARREDRLAAIEKAKAEIERRARERFEAEQVEYEAKLKRRQDKAEQNGKKAVVARPSRRSRDRATKTRSTSPTGSRASCPLRRVLCRPTMRRRG
jgi:hypothetical protein